MDQWIDVYSDEQDPLQKPTRILFRRDMSLNNFRRECSRAFGVDVVSLFAPDSRRVSDSSDLEGVHQIIISRHFYLRTEWSGPETPLAKSPVVKNFYDQFSDKQSIVARVEIIALPNTGKTTLIQRFLQHDYQVNEKNMVIEAVYHQKLDIMDHIVEFVLTDAIEDSVPDISDRIFNREVILLGVSKQTLLDRISSGQFELIEGWVNSCLERIHEISPNAYTAILLCKYDLICDSENVINEQLKALPGGLRVFKVSALEGMAVADVKNPHQVFMTIGQDLVERKSLQNSVERKKSSPTSKLAESLKLNRSAAPVSFWGAISCFRSFMG